MPLETLNVVTLHDITSIQIACQCGAYFTYNPDHIIRLPVSCHQCHADWKDDFHNTMDQQIVENFIRLIKEVRAQQAANPRLKIKLVFREEDLTGDPFSPNVR